MQDQMRSSTPSSASSSPQPHPCCLRPPCCLPASAGASTRLPPRSWPSCRGRATHGGTPMSSTSAPLFILRCAALAATQTGQALGEGICLATQGSIAIAMVIGSRRHIAFALVIACMGPVICIFAGRAPAATSQPLCLCCASKAAARQKLCLMLFCCGQGKDWAQIAMIKRLLETTPVHVAEWILAMDSEAIFNDPAVTFAFEFYGGRDVIVTGTSAGLITDGVPSECTSVPVPWGWLPADGTPVSMPSGAERSLAGLPGPLQPACREVPLDKAGRLCRRVLRGHIPFHLWHHG